MKGKRKIYITILCVGICICAIHLIFKIDLSIVRGKASDGVLDVSRHFQESKVFIMDGEWKFAKGFQSNTEEIETCLEVPSSWDKALIDGKHMSRFGEGTYLLHVKLPKPGTYSMLVQYISSAYKIYVNGEEVYSCGRFGESYAAEKAFWEPEMIYFHSEQNEADILIQVSNYHSLYGGIRTNLYFGSPKGIFRYQILHLVKAALIIGIFIGCGIYIIIINRSIENVSAYIWLGLFCISSINIVSVVDGGMVFLLFTHVTVEMAKRFQYCSIIGVLVSMRYFAECFFCDNPEGKGVYGIRIFNITAFLAGLFAPVNTQVYGYFFSFVLVAVNCSCFIRILVRAVIKRLAYAKIMTFGIVILAFCGFLQLVFCNMGAYNGFLSNYNTFVIGVLVFLLCQTYVLMKSVRKNYEDSRLAKDMEIAFLQAQISPHFFFNVINNIYYLMETEADKAKSLLISFSSYLRVKHKFDYRNTVFYTLKEELDLVNSFVEIENVRLNQKLDYFADVDEELMDTAVLPLTLQPLVENAIKHGFNGMPLELRVSVKKNGNHIHFEAVDNGKGMGRDKIFQIQSCQYKSGGVGLENINYRLDKCYGVKLKVCSEIGFGTKIEYDIPLEVQNGSSNY